MSEVPPRNALNLWKNGPVAVALEGPDGQARMLGANNPLPVALTAGATISDPDSAREATLQQVLTALLALGGNTDGLEALATQQKAVLDQMAAYVNDVEGLLTLIGNSTDGLEGLLNALGVKDDNVLAKLTEILAKDEQIRALLAGTLAISAAALPLPTGASTEATLAAQKLVIDAIKARLDLLAARTDTQPVSAASLPLPTGASTSVLQTAMNTILTAIQTAVQGTLAVKLNPDIPAIIVLNIPTNGTASDPILLNTQTVTMIDVSLNWSAADLSLEHSTDGGATWLPVYDRFGNALTFRVTANRSITLEPNDLWRKGRVRFRSGVPGAYVAQTAATTLTLTVVTV